MFYGNPVVNKNMKKNTTISHSLPRWDLFLVVLLVAGYSVIWLHPGSCPHQQETQSSRWWGVSMSWCHSGGFHEFSRKISRALDGSFWVLTWPFWCQILRLSTKTPNWNTPQATCNQDARKKASLSFLANGGLPELCFGGVPWFYVIFINRWVWRIADRISYSKHESYQSI